MSDPKVTLTAHHVAAAEAILSAGRRVLLIPVKEGGVKLFDVNQKEVKPQASQTNGRKPV